MPDHTSESYQYLVTEIYPRLVDAILQRYRSADRKSLLDVYQMDDDFLHLEPDAVQFVVTYRQEIISILTDPELFNSLAKLFILSTLEFTYANNQFIQMNEQENLRLENIYRSYLQEMKAILSIDRSEDELTSRLEKMVENHFAQLRYNLSRFLDPEMIHNPEGSPIFSRVVCRQYSPAFQLQTLDIQLEELVMPILDLGCGKAGRLVKYLRYEGLQAYGLDRMVEPSEYLLEDDWLAYRFEPGYWGTVIAHMGFTNHFYFQHVYKNGNPEPYARQYMAILKSLKPGGAFYYTPGVPFIEQLLPQQHFQIVKHHIRELESGLSFDLLYSVQIIRR